MHLTPSNKIYHTQFYIQILLLTLSTDYRPTLATFFCNKITFFFSILAEKFNILPTFYFNPRARGFYCFGSASTFRVIVRSTRRSMYISSEFAENGILRVINQLCRKHSFNILFFLLHEIPISCGVIYKVASVVFFLFLQHLSKHQRFRD